METTRVCFRMESETPRPSLDVDNLKSPRDVRKERERRIRRILRTQTSPEDKEKTRRIMRKYRRRQEKLDSDSDPDPYTPDYLFYCLETPPRR